MITVLPARGTSKMSLLCSSTSEDTCDHKEEWLKSCNGQLRTQYQETCITTSPQICPVDYRSQETVLINFDHAARLAPPPSTAERYRMRRCLGGRNIHVIFLYIRAQSGKCRIPSPYIGHRKDPQAYSHSNKYDKTTTTKDTNREK